jgi:hypothetical protein
MSTKYVTLQEIIFEYLKENKGRFGRLGGSFSETYVDWVTKNLGLVWGEDLPQDDIDGSNIQCYYLRTERESHLCTEVRKNLRGTVDEQSVDQLQELYDPGRSVANHFMLWGLVCSDSEDPGVVYVVSSGYSDKLVSRVVPLETFKTLPVASMLDIPVHGSVEVFPETIAWLYAPPTARKRGPASVGVCIYPKDRVGKGSSKRSREEDSDSSFSDEAGERVRNGGESSDSDEDASPTSKEKVKIPSMQGALLESDPVFAQRVRDLVKSAPAMSDTPDMVELMPFLVAGLTALKLCPGYYNHFLRLMGLQEAKCTKDQTEPDQAQKLKQADVLQIVQNETAFIREQCESIFGAQKQSSFDMKCFEDKGKLSTLHKKCCIGVTNAELFESICKFLGCPLLVMFFLRRASYGKKRSVHNFHARAGWALVSMRNTIRLRWKFGDEFFTSGALFNPAIPGFSALEEDENFKATAPDELYKYYIECLNNATGPGKLPLGCARNVAYQQLKKHHLYPAWRTKYRDLPAVKAWINRDFATDPGPIVSALRLFDSSGFEVTRAYRLDRYGRPITIKQEPGVEEVGHLVLPNSGAPPGMEGVGEPDKRVRVCKFFHFHGARLPAGATVNSEGSSRPSYRILLPQ